MRRTKMLGIVYNYVNQYDRPTYPTLLQRIVAWVKSFFTKEPPVVCDEGINLRELTCIGPNKVSDVLNLLVEEGVKPTITRTTNKGQGWYVEVTKKENFLKVASGHKVRYYSMTVDPYSLFDNAFYNVGYRVCTPGERDDLLKKGKIKTASAEAA
tara:strand:+ start:486 stop:950 length:465 start_codon:yes stop_codon:yes gene_type:complete